MHRTRNADHAGAAPAGGSVFNIGHEEDSNPRRSDRRDTRGSTEMPDHFPKRGRSCGRSSRVRVSGCEPEDPGANPGGHPI